MNPNMMIGEHITQPNDPLKKISVDEWINFIINPHYEVRTLIERLRTIRSMDESLYKEQKKKLPYGVCSIFHPPIRKKENFAAANCFMVDLDNLNSVGKSVEGLKEKLKNDSRVVATFTSPGNDGLKILFLFEKPCTDAVLFSTFYKIFLKNFSQQYELESAIDFRTSDVTRACFVSYDPSAYYNPNAEKIKIEDFIHNLDFEIAQEEIKQAEEFVSQNQNNTPSSKQLDDDILLKIKQKLDPNYRPKPTKQYYLPPEIDEKIPLIEQCFTDAGITIESKSPINFGKKLRIVAGNYWAEINIFHGKKGFSVVATPKSGSNKELGDLARILLQQKLFG